ncbi:MAG TPA: FAD-linked oxidase C-terminal domain-containing protein [Polyangiaceae bacterium]|jgi:FAD/FMN-containing dehydrogenase/Fe-S oxidoreductase
MTSELISPARLTRSVAQEEPQPRARVDLRGLFAELRRTVEGEVRFDDGSRKLYAHDASNYRQVPLGVVLPRSKEDAVAAIAACRRFGAPIVSRAGGTGLCGQTTNTAVVLDWSKYMNRIVELDPAGRFARVLPGVICDDVVHAAKPYELTYGPQPATHSHCCFGGMLANNSCGMYAQMAGKAVDNTEEMDIALYDGTRMTVGWMTDTELQAAIARGGREGEIYRRLVALRSRYGDRIRERYPHVPRRVSGYNLDSLLPDEDGRFNVARALVGSEGTCVTMLEMKVRLVHSPPKRALVVFGYPDVYRAADHILDVLEARPLALEGIDARLYEHVRQKHDPHEKYLGILPPGFGWLVVEVGGESEEEAREKAEALRSRIEKLPHAPSAKVLLDPAERKHLMLVRESGLGATAFVPGQPDTWEGWEDSAVAPADVGAYLRDLRALWDRYEYDSAMYGHFGMGCIHCRVNFDLKTQHGIAKWRRYMEEATDLVAVKYRGSISGEHGDGQSKAEFLYKMFGEDLVAAFREFKGIWDPDFKMNPGKVVDPYRIDENLRLGPDYSPWQPETHFKYPDDGGSFAHATLRCVGVGKCRRLNGEGDQDTMCPSFMVTREEKHSTRGRAHLLFEMLQQPPEQRSWRDEPVKEALDLCLSCKGCKGDCPVNVDLATYKAEFLSHYYEGRLRPRSAYAFGLIDKWARLASLAPAIANFLTQSPGLSALAKFMAGVSQDRPIPKFAPHTFRAWMQSRPPVEGTGERVVLWADTFNNYFSPHVAQAAVEVLEERGFRVEVPQGHLCCGRPLYDYGMLDLAKGYLERILHALRDAIAARTPIVVLEPSCCAVFRDELRALFPDRGDARLLSEQVMTLSEFLTSSRFRASGWKLPQLRAAAIVQGHCHHKAVMKFDPEKRVFEEMGLEARVLESGCCGMAGSFGYEKEKYDVSVAAGERVLLPEVRRAPSTTIVLADGFSCKSQIEQLTERRALHLAEALKLAKDGWDGSPYPERFAAEHRETALAKRSSDTLARPRGWLGRLVGGLLRWLFSPRRTARRRLV